MRRINRTPRWLLLWTLCCVWWPLAASAQDAASWQQRNTAGEAALRKGLYSEAERLLQAAIEQAEKLGANDPRLAISLDALAEAYYLQSKFAQGEALALRALAIRERAFGPDSLEVVGSLNNLGLLYHAQGRVTEAELVNQRALALEEKLLGPDHPAVATRLNNLVLMYHSQGRYAEAEPLARRALAIREKVLAPEHFAVA